MVGENSSQRTGATTASDASSWKQGLVGWLLVVVLLFNKCMLYPRTIPRPKRMAAVSPLAQWLHRLQTCFSLIEVELTWLTTLILPTPQVHLTSRYPRSGCGPIPLSRPNPTSAHLNLRPS